MLVRVHSAATLGIDARILDIEVDVSLGAPSFTMVGLPDPGVREARDRVRAALKNGGYPLAHGRITVNLAPAALRKAGAALDLPLAVAFLEVVGLSPASTSRRVFVGELGLNGQVRPTRGALCLALAARDAGFDELFLPEANAEEAAAVDGIRVIPVATLAATVAHLCGDGPISPARSSRLRSPAPADGPGTGDFSEIHGQAVARRALEIAAAGGHHVLLTGPPGSGKTMLARRISTVLPRLSRSESIEVTKVHSIAGTLPGGSGLVDQPPFRAPHHGISAAGLIGGGTRPGPGEISLAHRGVLFLDELPEFRRDVLEGIRQPLEERRVCVVRVGGACIFPSDFLLIAAMNPCPCGFAGDPRRMCRCSESQRVRYGRRISGPLLDRIDIHVAVPAVPWTDLERSAASEPSAGDPRPGREGAARRIPAFSAPSGIPQLGPRREGLRAFPSARRRRSDAARRRRRTDASFRPSGASLPAGRANDRGSRRLGNRGARARCRSHRIPQPVLRTGGGTGCGSG